MRRIILIGLFLVVIGVLVIFIWYTYSVKQDEYKKFKVMPTFTFTSIHNEQQSTITLPSYKGYVIQVFSPECEICQEEAKDFLQKNGSLQNILFIMLSTWPIENIKDFALKQQLYNADNFMFGHIKPETVNAHFGQVSLPTLYIYNAEKKLLGKERIADSYVILNYFQNKTK